MACQEENYWPLLTGLSEKTVRRGQRELAAGLTDCPLGHDFQKAAAYLNV